MRNIFQLTIKAVDYINRRTILAENILKKYCKENHVIILPAADVQYQTHHIPRPYHQDTAFYYYTGFVNKKSLLLMNINNSTIKTTLFIDNPSAEYVLWNGPYPTKDSAKSVTGIDNIEHNEDFMDLVMSSISNKENSILWITNSTNMTTFNEEIYKLAKIIKPMNLSSIIDKQKVIKSPSEIEIMRQAANITSEALQSTFSFTRPSMNEQQILAKLLFEINMRGAKLAYPPVIAGGTRANIIHYLDSNQNIEDNELVLVDVGANVLGYFSDITRTWPVNGYFTKEQGILYDILHRIHLDCIEICYPDKSLNDMHGFMIKQLEKYLIEEGIVKNLKSAFEYCPHHIGHYLGLDIHDTPSISTHAPLLPGTVFPMEPGLYISKNNNSVDPRYRGIGMRLEDDFVMTETGVDCLNNGLARSRAEIELLCNSSVKEFSKSIY